MSHILITNRTGKTTRLHIGAVQWVLILAVIFSAFGGAFYYGTQQGSQKAEPDVMVMVMQNELHKYKQNLDDIKQNSETNMNALAVRLGEVKANVIRLDALGQRLIEKAKLEKGEFNFENAPAQGGPEVSRSESGETMSVPDFMSAMDDLANKMDRSSLQLGVLESMIMNRELQGDIYPSGRPIKRGWISSYFGFRTDPFNGRRARHDGIDLAGKKGSEVIAVASGVITWAGKRYGYGNLVEINHGNGYVTRYGHNEIVEVKVGEAVKKGDTIARMGSTGRSTGPHVHFEVHKNGRVVDPMKYVRSQGG